MNIFFAISFVALICIAVFTIVMAFCKIKIKFKQFKIIILLIIIFLTTLTYFFEPKDFIRWDLIEHYKLIEKMRVNGWAWTINSSPYKNLYVINIFFYLISLLPNNALLPTIPMFINLCIFGYILLDQMKQKYNDLDAVDMKVATIIIIAFFGTVSLQLAISGIRNVLAASLVALGVYLEFVKKKKFILAILLYLSAIWTHSFAIFYVGIRLIVFVFSFKWTKKFMPILLFVYPLSIVFFKVCEKFGSGFILVQAKRMLNYLGAFDFHIIVSESYWRSLLLYFANIGIFICLYFLISQSKNKLFTPRNISIKGYVKEENRINHYMRVIILLGIGLSFNFLLIQRYMYLVAFILVMFLPKYYFTHSINNRVTNMLLLLSGYGFLYDFEGLIINYTGFLKK